MTTTTRNNKTLSDTQETTSPVMNEAPSRPSRSMTNIALRIITGLVFLPCILFVTFSGGVWFMAFGLVLATIGTVEYFFMEQRWTGRGSNTWLGLPFAIMILISFYIQNLLTIFMLPLVLFAVVTLIEHFHRHASPEASLRRGMTSLFGVLYLAVPTGMLILIRESQPFGLSWLYAILFATWGADVFAYLVGSKWGKTPLAPRLSPKKTVEGAIGGIFGGIFFPSLVLAQMHALTPSIIPLLLLTPFFAIAGDLFESWLKRSCDVKDSGVKGFNPLPGHGGVLDRVDALLWVIILFYTYLSFMGVVGF